MQRRPGAQVGADRRCAAVAGKQQQAATAPREVYAQRRRSAQRLIQRLLGLRALRVEHHEHARVDLGGEAPFHQHARSGDGRPVDARCRGARAVRAQRVERERSVERRGAAVVEAAQREHADRVHAGEHEQPVLAGDQLADADAERIGHAQTRRAQRLATAARHHC